MRLLNDVNILNHPFDNIDIIEALSISIIPEWDKEYDTVENRYPNECPDRMRLEIQCYMDDCTCVDYGIYHIKGDKNLFDDCMSNYKKAIDEILVKGYGKLSDFKGIEWI